MLKMKAIPQGDIGTQPPSPNFNLEKSSFLTFHTSTSLTYFLPQYRFSHLTLYLYNHFAMLINEKP